MLSVVDDRQSRDRLHCQELMYRISRAQSGAAVMLATAYFSILLCNCQKRTVRCAVSIESLR